MNRIDLIHKCYKKFGAYWFYDTESGEVNSVDGWLDAFEEVKDDEALEEYHGDGVAWFCDAITFDELRAIIDIDNSLDAFLSDYTIEFYEVTDWYKEHSETPDAMAEYLLNECIKIGYPEYASLCAVWRFLKRAKRVNSTKV